MDYAVLCHRLKMETERIELHLCLARTSEGAGTGRIRSPVVTEGHLFESEQVRFRDQESLPLCQSLSAMGDIQILSPICAAGLGRGTAKEITGERLLKAAAEAETEEVPR